MGNTQRMRLTSKMNRNDVYYVQNNNKLPEEEEDVTVFSSLHSCSVLGDETSLINCTRLSKGL